MNAKLAGDDANQALMQAWEALGSYRDQAILVGGMAVFIYQMHPDFRGIRGIAPLPTVDIDVAVSNPLLAEPQGNLAQQLVDAGFVRREVRREETCYTRFDLPAAMNRTGEMLNPYIEFLCATDEIGVRDDEPQQGLRAHLSPYAWMLFHEPWSIHHPSGMSYRVPHPLTYFVQKLLIRGTRPLVKRTKDLVDVLFVMGGFRERLPDIFAARQTIALHHDDGVEQIANACGEFERLFTGHNPTGPVQIAAGYSENVTTPEMQQVAAIAALVANDIVAAERQSR